MKVAILSRDKSLYSCQRLKEVAERRKHSVEIINPLLCHIGIGTSASAIYHQGRLLPRYDAIIPRIGPATAFYGMALLRQFELLGSYALNSSVAMSCARDKLRTFQLLAQQGVDLPITALAHSLESTDQLIALVGGPPLVIKLVEGSQGVGVVLAETLQAAESVIDALRGLNAHILVQEYIQEAQGRDIRCVVIDNKVVAAMERSAREGDFRSNLHRGGTGKQVEISVKEREMAIHATKILGLNVAGVDILRAKRGPLVMEVNASLGLEGIEQVTRVDVAEMIVEFIERQGRNWAV